MLRLHQIRLPLESAAEIDPDVCRRMAAQKLGVPKTQIEYADVGRCSVDARNKNDVHFTLSLDVHLGSELDEKRLSKKYQPNEVAFLSNYQRGLDAFALPVKPYRGGRPIVVGAGPAGLFCALALALRGARPLVLERGMPVDQRVDSIALLERDGALDPESNVLFGEGGAGAFSDGKLTCGLNDPMMNVVLQTLVTCGAPHDILTSARPHIGTDKLRGVLMNLRKKLISLGGNVRFECAATGLLAQNGYVRGVRTVQHSSVTIAATDAVFLAIGHSARDTYEWLHALGVPMERKPFAVGVRIEHLQQSINEAQYGRFATHPALPPADYKLNVSTPDERGAYTFCMCPGGRVINASSEAGLLNVNGMSLHARDGVNANSALLVGVRPDDYGPGGPLAGVEFQRNMERAAFLQGGGGYVAPCQRVCDFLAGRPSTQFGAVEPSYRPGARAGDVAACLPDYVAAGLRHALPLLGQRLRGFDDGDALLTGVETRSSAPVRILRDENRQSPLGGLYPLGEGAGYAGGIMSAAVDGLRAGLETGADE